MMKYSIKDLKKIPDFVNVPDQQLQWLIDKSYIQTFKQGEYVLKKGEPIDNLSIILKGYIDLKIQQNGNYKLIKKMGPNTIGGVLPFSRLSSSIGYSEVIEDSEILFLNKSFFREMVANHYELTESLVHHMTSRVRELTRDNVQSEKMMALGKLSAGLAHELNNPASAMQRSAKALKKHLSHVPEKFKRIMSIDVSEEEIDTINNLIFDRINNRPENNMKLTERLEKEDELELWLEEHGVENAFEYTETFLDFCMDATVISEIHNNSQNDNFLEAIEWIEDVLTTEKIIDEIDEASDRISSLVKSIKSYTHMDQTPEKINTDIHVGIKSTLIMLNHKFKRKNIALEKHFEKDLPQPKLFVSEINQVWTNLIDNAIDAMDHSGKLIITTSKDNNFIKITITDNGHGIPEEHINQIFDPFFTTKSIGKGTGMGLEVVQRIINQHNGEIKVTSKKGETTFTVCLPI